MQQIKNGPDIIELDLSDEEYNFNQPKKKKKLPFDNKPFYVILFIFSTLFRLQRSPHAMIF
jgi:hypothetical protein